MKFCSITRRNLKIAFGLLLACYLAPGWPAEIAPYPSGWPQLKRMSADCREVSGTYIDPNLMHWKSVEQHGGVTAKHGGSLEAAWPLFGFLDRDKLRLNDTTIKSRAFSISFAADDVLVIDYYVEGNLVSTRRLERNKWACGKDGLKAATLERTGVISDLIPNDGWSTRTVILYRVGSDLIVKEINESRISYLHVIPRHDQAQRWFRFPSVDQISRSGVPGIAAAQTGLLTTRK